MAGSSNIVQSLYKGILSRDRSSLAKAITLTESTLAADRKISERLLKKLLPHSGKSIRIGITGVPGVGKSTLIEAFGEYLAAQGKRIGVLAIDPTSRKTKGSILGDKTRMPALSKNPSVYIRPSPSALTLGGVSHHTRETMLLCEAAGFDVILIETVGVGQSETEVRNMVDFFLLLILPGAGDELQGIKKGIMEMADGIAITKSDGDNVRRAQQAQADAATGLHLIPAADSGWKPRIVSTSGIEGTGLDKLWEMVCAYRQQTEASGFFESNRTQQKVKWLDTFIEDRLKAMLLSTTIARKKSALQKKVMNDEMLASEAALELWKILLKK